MNEAPATIRPSHRATTKQPALIAATLKKQRQRPGGSSDRSETATRRFAEFVCLPIVWLTVCSWVSTSMPGAADRSTSAGRTRVLAGSSRGSSVGGLT